MINKLTWQTVALLAILGGIAVALAIASPWEPAEILALLGVLGGLATGAAVGGAVAGGVQHRVEEVHAETQAQTRTLDTVARRVNGELDGRISAAMEEAAETGAARAVAALRQEIARQGAAETMRYTAAIRDPGRGGLPLAEGGQPV